MSTGNTGLLVTAAGLAVFWLGLRQLRARHLLRGGLAASMGLATLTAGALLVGLSATFHVYERLSGEQVLGSIRFVELGSGAYEAALSLAAADAPQYFRLTGDEWQLDVRFLKWEWPATVAGLDSLYQLDRLSGRYRDPTAQRTQEITAYGLTSAPGTELWRLAGSMGRWAPWIDAVYGNATYLPMSDGAAFTIAVTPTGILARPANDVARASVEEW